MMFRIFTFLNRDAPDDIRFGFPLLEFLTLNKFYIVIIVLLNILYSDLFRSV